MSKHYFFCISLIINQKINREKILYDPPSYNQRLFFYKILIHVLNNTSIKKQNYFYFLQYNCRSISRFLLVLTYTKLSINYQEKKLRHSIPFQLNELLFQKTHYLFTLFNLQYKNLIHGLITLIKNTFLLVILYNTEFKELVSNQRKSLKSFMEFLILIIQLHVFCLLKNNYIQLYCIHLYVLTLILKVCHIDLKFHVIFRKLILTQNFSKHHNIQILVFIFQHLGINY